MITPDPVRALIVAALVLAATLSAARAAETTVKNDSIIDNGQAVIVGDFIVGERAAARLTSPCNGTIVAVQILWLEGTPGHEPSLETAIHIYNGATFPAPGPELAFLDSPLLTPGGWNEFRYLDEANTIPLNVPVTTGQPFYVALEFGEATDVGNGGPSVVRDTDGCQSGKNDLYAIPGGWMSFCLFLQGDLAIRAVVNCADPTGACCFADGSCQVKTAAQCSQAAGTYRGDGTTCSPNPCPAPGGACCFSNGNCLAMNAADCATTGGTWLGAGTTCNGTQCPLGACCFADGSCQVRASSACATAGGTYQGTGTTCTPNNCPQPGGACCFGNGNCLVLASASCTLAGGSWKGALTDCADHNGDGHADACAPPILHGDLNCDGNVNFADINPFVLALTGQAAYQAAFPGCNWLNADCNGDGQVNFADINPFVACLSQGCP